MKIRRLLAMLLVCLMLLACVAGCGSKDTNEAETAPAETEAAPAEEKAATPEAEKEPAVEAEEEPAAEPETEPVEEEKAYSLPLTEETETLSYFFYMNGQNLASIPDPEDLNFFRLAEAVTNVHIDYTLFGSYDEEWSTMLASGDWCDMIDNVYNYPGGYGQALADEFILELSDLIESDMPNYNKYRQSNEEYYKDTMLDDGSVACVWGLVSDARGAYPTEYGPLVRKDWLDEQGLELPETYDDWHNVLSVFKQNYDAYMWAPATGVTLYGLFGAGYGINGYTASARAEGPYYVEDGEVKFGAITDEYKEFLQMFNQWYEEGLIDPDFMSNKNPYAPDQANVVNGRWGIIYCIKDLIDVYTAVSEGTISLCPIADPVKVAGTTNSIAYTTSLIQKQNTGICATAENPELCAKWLDFWYSDEGIMIANYGEEGVTYEYGEDGEPHYTEFMTNNPDGTALNVLLYVYARNQGSYMNLWFKTIETYSDATVQAMTTWSVHSPSKNYPNGVTMTAEEVTQHTALVTDILVYVEEYTTGLMIGNNSFDDWDAYVEQVWAMGLEDCLALKQAAYDRYLQR